MKPKNRTEAQTVVGKASFEKGYSVFYLTNMAVYSGVFRKPTQNGNGNGDKETYSPSWVRVRLKENDMRVARKLVEFAKTL